MKHGFQNMANGRHIQQDRVLIVALVRERLSWCLRRWWAIPLTEGIILDGKICQPEQLLDALRGWRRTLPHQHRVFLSFPAARTLQRSLPARLSPCATANSSRLGAALSRELEMSPDALCFDYAQDTFSNTFHVTAVQNKEVETLLTLAKTLHLRLVTITPDASALANFLPAVAPAQCVAWRDEHQWLWAMRHQWGAASLPRPKAWLNWRHCWLSRRTISRCLIASATRGSSSRCQPPLPECGADYTVALALAMSEVPE